MKKLSSRKGMFKKFSSRRVVVAVDKKEQQKEEDMGNLIHEVFKANQIRFAQYLESKNDDSNKEGGHHFTDYANSRQSWATEGAGAGAGGMEANAQSAVEEDSARSEVPVL
jgi:hypothetical protein